MTRVRTAVSIDPGETVGIAFWRWDDAAEVWVLESVVSWSGEQFLRWVDEGGLARYDLVAWERYLLGGGREALYQTGSEMVASRQIGVIEAETRRHECETATTDRTKKRSAHRRIARRAGRVPGRNPHQRDAVSVLVSATGRSVDGFRFR